MDADVDFKFDNYEATRRLYFAVLGSPQSVFIPWLGIFSFLSESIFAYDTIELEFFLLDILPKSLLLTFLIFSICFKHTHTFQQGVYVFENFVGGVWCMTVFLYKYAVCHVKLVRELMSEI